MIIAARFENEGVATLVFRLAGTRLAGTLQRAAGRKHLRVGALDAGHFDIGLVNEKGIDRRLLETQ